MGGDILKYLGGVFFLVFVYLVVVHGNDTVSVFNSLSKANTNTILALQGRSPQ